MHGQGCRHVRWVPLLLPNEVIEMETESNIREQAVSRLKKKSEFKAHLIVYVLVNTLVVSVWAMTGTNHFFWPVFPIAGWGIGVVMNAWDVYRKPPSEHAIRREMDHLR